MFCVLLVRNHFKIEAGYEINKKIIIIFLLISYPASILKWFLTSNTQNVSVIGDLILAFTPVLNIFYLFN